MVLILRGLVPLLTLLCFLCSALSCIIIDNVDPQIQYQGTWVFETIYGGSPDYNGTLAHTNETQASVTFHFTGSSVAVYGAIKPVGTWDILSAYCLDDVPMGVYKPDPSVQAERDRVLFYASGPLGPGNHTLVVENMGEQFWLDYIGVGGPDDNPANPCPGPSLDPPTPSGSSSSSITGLSSSDTHQSSWSGITSSSKTVNPASSTQPSNTSNSWSTSNPASSATIISDTPIALTQHISSTSSQTTLASSTTGSVAHSSAVPGPERRVSTVVYTGAIAGIVVAGIVVLLAVVATTVILHRRRKLGRVRSIITPFDTNTTLPTNRPPTPPLGQLAKSPCSTTDSPITHLVDLLEPSELNPDPVPERASAPPAIHARVLNIRRGGTGTWADYRSSAPTSRGHTRASTMMSMSGMGTGAGKREREARFTWSTGKAVFGSSDEGGQAERVPRRRG